MVLAELEDFLVDVDGSAEGVAPAASEPEGDESFLLVLLHHFPQLPEVQLVVALLCDIDVGHCPLVINVLDRQPAVRADVAALAEVADEAQDGGVVTLDGQLLHLLELGRVHRHEH